VIAALGAETQSNSASNAALRALLPELAERVDELIALGLGHLSVYMLDAEKGITVTRSMAAE